MPSWLYSLLNLRAMSSTVRMPLELVREMASSRPNLVNRCGWSFASRHAGPCIWFHIPDLGFCSAALPVIFRCLQEYNEKVGILVTVASPEARDLLEKVLPKRVVVQLKPLDNPVTAALFMKKWRPQVGIFMESPFDTNLILIASQFNVRLALINARLKASDLLSWHAHIPSRRLLQTVLQSFSLVVPQSDEDVGHLRILGTTMQQMPGWSSDLEQISALGPSLWRGDFCLEAIQNLKKDIEGRQAWLASNIDVLEEKLMVQVHKKLQEHSGLEDLFTIIAPRDPARCSDLARLLRSSGFCVEIWSEKPVSYASDILLLDDPSQLSLFQHACEIVYLGGSLMAEDEAAITSISEVADAAVANCALLLGSAAAQTHLSGLATSLNMAAVHASEEAAAAVMNSGQAVDDFGPYSTPGPFSRGMMEIDSAGREWNAGSRQSSRDRQSLSRSLATVWQFLSSPACDRPSSAPAVRGQSHSAGQATPFKDVSPPYYARMPGPGQAHGQGRVNSRLNVDGTCSESSSKWESSHYGRRDPRDSPSWRKLEMTELLTPRGKETQRAALAFMSGSNSSTKSDACTQTELTGISDLLDIDHFSLAMLSNGSEVSKVDSDDCQLMDAHACIWGNFLRPKRESFASWMQSSRRLSDSLHGRVHGKPSPSPVRFSSCGNIDAAKGQLISSHLLGHQSFSPSKLGPNSASKLQTSSCARDLEDAWYQNDSLLQMPLPAAHGESEKQHMHNDSLPKKEAPSPVPGPEDQAGTGHTAEQAQEGSMAGCLDGSSSNDKESGGDRTPSEPSSPAGSGASITLSPRKPPSTSMELGHGPGSLDSNANIRPSWMALNANGDLCSDVSSGGTPTSPVDPHPAFNGNYARRSYVFDSPQRSTKERNSYSQSGTRSSLDTTKSREACTAAYNEELKSLAKLVDVESVGQQSSGGASSNLLGCESMEAWLKDAAASHKESALHQPFSQPKSRLAGRESRDGTYDKPTDAHEQDEEEPDWKDYYNHDAGHEYPETPRSTTAAMCKSPLVRDAEFDRPCPFSSPPRQCVVEARSKSTSAPPALPVRVKTPRSLSVNATDSANKWDLMDPRCGDAAPIASAASAASALSSPVSPDELFACLRVHAASGTEQPEATCASIRTPRASELSSMMSMGPFDGPVEDIPDTPTSRMTSNSIFAMEAVFDRPDPYQLLSTGSIAVPHKHEASSTRSLLTHPPPGAAVFGSLVADITLGPWQEMQRGCADQDRIMGPNKFADSPLKMSDPQPSLQPKSVGLGSGKPPLPKPTAKSTPQRDKDNVSSSSSSNNALALLEQTEQTHSPSQRLCLKMPSPVPSPSASPAPVLQLPSPGPSVLASPARSRLAGSEVVSSPRHHLLARSRSMPGQSMHKMLLVQQAVEAASSHPGFEMTAALQPVSTTAKLNSKPESFVVRGENGKFVPEPKSPRRLSVQQVGHILNEQMSLVAPSKRNSPDTDKSSFSAPAPGVTSAEAPAMEPSKDRVPVPPSPRRLSCSSGHPSSSNNADSFKEGATLPSSPKTAKAELLPPPSPRKSDTPRCGLAANRLRQSLTSSPVRSPCRRLFAQSEDGGQEGAGIISFLPAVDALENTSVSAPCYQTECGAVEGRGSLRAPLSPRHSSIMASSPTRNSPKTNEPLASRALLLRAAAPAVPQKPSGLEGLEHLLNTLKPLNIRKGGPGGRGLPASAAHVAHVGQLLADAGCYKVPASAVCYATAVQAPAAMQSVLAKCVPPSPRRRSVPPDDAGCIQVPPPASPAKSATSAYKNGHKHTSSWGSSEGADADAILNGLHSAEASPKGKLPSSSKPPAGITLAAVYQELQDLKADMRLLLQAVLHKDPNAPATSPNLASNPQAAQSSSSEAQAKDSASQKQAMHDDAGASGHQKCPEAASTEIEPCSASCHPPVKPTSEDKPRHATLGSAHHVICPAQNPATYIPANSEMVRTESLQSFLSDLDKDSGASSRSSSGSFAQPSAVNVMKHLMQDSISFSRLATLSPLDSLDSPSQQRSPALPGDLECATTGEVSCESKSAINQQGMCTMEPLTSHQLSSLVSANSHVHKALASKARPAMGNEVGSYIQAPRLHGECIIPGSQLPRGSCGPAVWCISHEEDFVLATSKLLRDPVERRSRGIAAAQGAAKLASGLVSDVWNVLDATVITPGLHDFIKGQDGVC